MGAGPGTTEVQALKQRSFALAADKPPLFRLNRAGIGRFTVRTATSQSRVDEVVVPAAEEIATGIAAAIDLVFVRFEEYGSVILGAHGRHRLFG